MGKGFEITESNLENKVKVITRSVFEQHKGLFTEHPQYVTHFCYKRGDVPFVALCLRGK